jgi:hypothetical protein
VKPSVSYSEYQAPATLNERRAVTFLIAGRVMVGQGLAPVSVSQVGGSYGS